MIRLLRFLPSRWWSLHAWRTWGTYMHWRLETFGVFHPSRSRFKNFKQLLQQGPSYYRWLGEMDRRHDERPRVRD